MIHRSLHCFCLFRGQLDSLVPFPFPDDFLVIHLPQGIHIIPEGQQPIGHPFFRPVEIFWIYAHMVPHIFCPEHIVLQELLEHLLHFQGIYLKDFSCHIHQPSVRHTRMALVGSLEQRIVDPRPDPVLGMFVHTQVPGQGVCRPEADAIHIFRQAVGIVADPGHRCISVQCLDPGRKAAADSMAFQEKHQFPVFSEFPIGGDDGFGLLFPDPADFPQPFRGFFQDFQGFFPELVHDPLGHGRPHPFQDSAAQHLHQTFRSLGLDSFPAPSLELTAEPGMVPPASGKTHLFSGKRSLSLVDHRNRPHFRIFSPEYTERPFRSLENDIFDGKFNRYWSGHAPLLLLNICFTYYSTVFRFF